MEGKILRFVHICYFIPVLLELFFCTVAGTVFLEHDSMIEWTVGWVCHHVSDSVVEPELDGGEEILHMGYSL